MSIVTLLRCAFRRPAIFLFTFIGFYLRWSLLCLFPLEQTLNTQVESAGTSGTIQSPDILFNAEESQDAPYKSIDPDDVLRVLRSEFLPSEKQQQERLASEHGHLTAACSKLNRDSEKLPDTIYIPFEKAVSEVKLRGWEDAWISNGTFDAMQWGSLEEPKIDFVYTWVNGSDSEFFASKHPYELASPLNDPEGVWLATHGVNRYRDWNELRYSFRSIAANARSFMNRVQILVNGLDAKGTKQRPQWLHENAQRDSDVNFPNVEVISHEDFFDNDKKVCLPTFNSLTIENQIFNTPSDVDTVFTMSDDMLLTTEHAASDIFSPLLGPAMGFKSNTYNVRTEPNAIDVHRFGEKPYLIYTSWLLNRRFGERKRHGQAHFGHTISRSIAREALESFPRPAMKSASRRFRGEPGPSGELGLQIYSWYLFYHYTIERHREALLQSYIVHRSDTNQDGFLDWDERQNIMAEIEHGLELEASGINRSSFFDHMDTIHNNAGLQPPQAGSLTLWTSLDGPIAIRRLQCPEFNVDECLAPGFSLKTDAEADKRNPLFTTAAIWDHVSRQQPKCGDCLMKILLNQAEQGMEPLLPHPTEQVDARNLIVKALMRYKYSVVKPNAWFEMITNAEQVEANLTTPLLRSDEKDRPVVGQLCLNDDVLTSNETKLEQLQSVMHELFDGLFPDKSPWEK